MYTSSKVANNGVSRGGWIRAHSEHVERRENHVHDELVVLVMLLLRFRLLSLTVQYKKPFSAECVRSSFSASLVEFSQGIRG